MSEKYHPLVEKARREYYGDGGIVAEEDFEEWSKLSKRDKARYLGARDNCNVVETLATDPHYGPEYQIRRYGSVNFWYKFLKERVFNEKPGFEHFGADVLLHNVGGIRKHDKNWVPKKNKMMIKGPATFEAYVLPRQIIDIIDKNPNQLNNLLNGLDVCKNPTEAIVSLALLSVHVGISPTNAYKRIFDEDYQAELPWEYWLSDYQKTQSALGRTGFPFHKVFEEE